MTAPNVITTRHAHAPLFSRIIVYNVFKVKLFCRFLMLFVVLKTLTFFFVYNPYFLCVIYTVNSFQMIYLYAPYI